MSAAIKKILEQALYSARSSLDTHKRQLKEESKELAEMIKQDRLGRQRRFVLQIGQWIKSDQDQIRELEAEIAKHERVA